jgi:hypothetical protein
MTGERIREVKEETERQLGRGTGADSFTRRPRLAQGNAEGGYAPLAITRLSAVERECASNLSGETAQRALKVLRGLSTLDRTTGRTRLRQGDSP